MPNAQCPMTADARLPGNPDAATPQVGKAAHGAGDPTHCLPNAQCPMPIAQCPMPNAQSLADSAKRSVR
ncbi:MAG: hypothetical protein KME31_21800 [Tolypothrix carrinoi HA7290-LM1]|jgi:hypothetical protein|nr:hypothetical protein [Tolypothrix carrinoi HA7290-LM1]